MHFAKPKRYEIKLFIYLNNKTLMPTNNDFSNSFFEDGWSAHVQTNEYQQNVTAIVTGVHLKYKLKLANEKSFWKRWQLKRNRRNEINKRISDLTDYNLYFAGE